MVLWYVSTGKLDKGAVLKAICAGFKETTEPGVCLSEGQFAAELLFSFFACLLWHLLWSLFWN